MYIHIYISRPLHLLSLHKQAELRLLWTVAVGRGG